MVTAYLTIFIIEHCPFNTSSTELNESSVKAPAPVEKRKRKRQDKAAPKAKRTVTTAEEIEEEAAAIETTDTRAHPELITLREEIGSGPPPELVCNYCCRNSVVLSTKTVSPQKLLLRNFLHESYYI